MMNVSRVSVALLLVCICVLLCGCRNPRADAIDAVKTELAARRTRRTRSMELCVKGRNAQANGDIALARKCLNDAIKADDRNAHAWMALGILEFEQDELHEAALALHRASRLEPHSYEPLFNIGLILDAAGKYPQAIKKYEAALHLAPDQVEVMENLARCYIHSDTKLDKAKELVERALSLESRSEWIRWLERQSQYLERKGND